jgi:hypothetical protein
MTPQLEVLYVPDCPHLAQTLERLHAVTDLPVTIREIGTEADAIAAGMAGSPTLLIDGIDPFGQVTRRDLALSCRLYRDEEGRIVSGPSVEQLRAAIAAATLGTPGAVLSAWRTREVPLDPIEKAAHQAILRGFALTGRPPAVEELAPIAGRDGRGIAEVLAALHEVDAIRLARDGRIAVAYPFSAPPTRHLVRLGNGVEVFAMCAIDALGIAPMLGVETLIESADGTSGAPITVTMTVAGASTWEPSTGAVFVGAAASGPSADCCCDYLNFFTDRTAAQAWAENHPHVPGQVLDKLEAEALGARLFGPLLQA